MLARIERGCKQRHINARGAGMALSTICSAAIGFAAVAFGAFGAHGLASVLDETGAEVWRTATLYGLVHALGGLIMSWRAGPMAKTAAWSFIGGSLVFSGALYGLALGAPRMLGAVAPVGGLLFLFGWACAALDGRGR